ncbi:NAD(P)/FAD-dependent oxidoreductase [Natronospirillum operosum]|uniref:NAD(P)/FAD-dependent oxidoreductase n=2 Tax=Natronospirillum operosum TaxID=2759953 RepID=A0A4Z0WFD6_9GAMM|nr:NAD(P)/FAD-dependent oxidoreductase [Natronospirillum operosum]
MGADMRQRWIIVGHGMVAMRLLREIVALRPEQVQLVCIGEEALPGYSRIGLSDVLAGKRDIDSLQDVATDWYERHDIQSLHGRVVTIDRPRKRVTLADGNILHYDRLLLATGSAPRLPDVPGIDLPQVRPFRTVEDVCSLLAVAPGSRAVVLGGGLLGLEAAVGLAGRGVEVTLVHREGWLMNRQLDRQAGDWLEEALAQRGVRFLKNTEAAAIEPEGAACRVDLVSGERLPADVVVPAIGIVPRVDLARDAGLEVGRGVVVNDWLQTSDAAICALGECAEHRGTGYGLVAPLYEQARVLARQLVTGQGSYTGSAVSTQLKVSGVPVFSAGAVEAEDPNDLIVWRDEAHREYRKLILRNNRLVGAVLFGDVRDGQFYQDLIERQVDVSTVRQTLVFGAAFCTELPAQKIEIPEQVAA